MSGFLIILRLGSRYLGCTIIPLTNLNGKKYTSLSISGKRHQLSGLWVKLIQLETWCSSCVWCFLHDLVDLLGPPRLWSGVPRLVLTAHTAMSSCCCWFLLHAPAQADSKWWVKCSALEEDWRKYLQSCMHWNLLFFLRWSLNDSFYFLFFAPGKDLIEGRQRFGEIIHFSTEASCFTTSQCGLEIPVTSVKLLA